MMVGALDQKTANSHVRETPTQEPGTTGASKLLEWVVCMQQPKWLWFYAQVVYVYSILRDPTQTPWSCKYGIHTLLGEYHKWL